MFLLIRFKAKEDIAMGTYNAHKVLKTGFCVVYFFNSSFFSFSFPVFMNEGGKMDTIDVPLAYFVGFEITEQNRIDMLYKRN